MDKQINIHKIRALGKAKVTQAIPTLLNLLGELINKEDKSEQDNLTINEIKNTLIKFNIVGFYELKQFIDKDTLTVSVAGVSIKEYKYRIIHNDLIIEIIDILSQIRHEEVIKYLITLYDYELYDSQISLALAKMMKNPFMEEIMLQLNEDDVPKRLKRIPLDNERWYYKKWYFIGTAPFEYVEQKIRNDLFSDNQFYSGKSFHGDDTISFKILFPMFIKSWRTNDFQENIKSFKLIYELISSPAVYAQIIITPYLKTKTAIKSLIILKQKSEDNLQRFAKSNKTYKTILKWFIMICFSLLFIVNSLSVFDIWTYHQTSFDNRNDLIKKYNRKELKILRNKIDSLDASNKSIYPLLDSLQEIAYIKIYFDKEVKIHIKNRKENQLSNNLINLVLATDPDYEFPDSIFIWESDSLVINLDKEVNNSIYIDFKHLFPLTEYVNNSRVMLKDDTTDFLLYPEYERFSNPWLNFNYVVLDTTLLLNDGFIEPIYHYKDENLHNIVDIQIDTLIKRIRTNNVEIQKKVLRKLFFNNQIIQETKWFLYIDHYTFPEKQELNFFLLPTDSLKGRTEVSWLFGDISLFQFISYIKAEFYQKQFYTQKKLELKESIAINKKLLIFDYNSLHKYYWMILILCLGNVILFSSLTYYLFRLHGRKSNLKAYNINIFTELLNILPYKGKMNKWLKFFLFVITFGLLSCLPTMYMITFYSEVIYAIYYTYLPVFGIYILLVISSFFYYKDIVSWENPIYQLLKEFPEGKRLIDKI